MSFYGAIGFLDRSMPALHSLGSGLCLPGETEVVKASTLGPVSQGLLNQIDGRASDTQSKWASNCKTYMDPGSDEVDLLKHAQP